MRKFWEAAVIMVGTLGWWGFIYPELSVTEAETAGFAAENTAGDIESDMESDVKEIRIKSKLAEYVCEIKEKQEKDLNHDK